MISNEEFYAKVLRGEYTHSDGSRTIMLAWDDMDHYNPETKEFSCPSRIDFTRWIYEGHNGYFQERYGSVGSQGSMLLITLGPPKRE
jgi:hypothetical protein